MCVNREGGRENSKVKAARRDHNVRRGAPTRDEVAIHTFKYVYRELNRIFTRTRSAARYEFFEMKACLLSD